MSAALAQAKQALASCCGSPQQPHALLVGTGSCMGSMRDRPCCSYDLKALGDSVVNTFLGELGGCKRGAGAPRALLVSMARCCP